MLKCTFQFFHSFHKFVSRVIKTRPARAPTVGYGELLRGNRSFRLLWLGQVVNQMGDWFDTIAVYTIALRLTGSGRAVALIMVARFLPSVVMGPLSGVVADRFSRRSIMITADLLRAIVVLGFLLVRRPDPKQDSQSERHSALLTPSKARATSSAARGC